MLWERFDFMQRDRHQYTVGSGLEQADAGSKNASPLWANPTANPFVATADASVTLSTSTPSPAAGDIVTVGVIVGFDTDGAGSGVFGSAGLYGFGGDLVATGVAASDLSGQSVGLDTQLPFAGTWSVGEAPGVARAAAGRGFSSGLAGSPVTVLTADIVVDPGGVGGAVTIGFDGAVVLALGSSLTTFSTDPGPNQFSLTVTPLVLTVESGACSPADLNADGTINLDDLDAFVMAFLAGCP